MPDISKINALAIGSVSKVDGLAKASILDINGITVTDPGINPDAATSGFLFTYSAASVAFSVRQLNNNADYVMRVRRVTGVGNTGNDDEADVKFDTTLTDPTISLDSPVDNFSAGGSNATTLGEFLNVGTVGGTTYSDADSLSPNTAEAYATTWYDLTGNQNHAEQTTPANQPQIHDGTVNTDLITENGKPAVKFNTNHLQLPTAAWNKGDHSIFMVTLGNGNNQQYYNLSPDFAANWAITAATSFTNSVAVRLWTDATSRDTDSASLTNGTQFLLSSLSDVSTFIIEGYIDGTAMTGNTNAGANVDRMTLGARDYQNGEALDGVIQEFVLFADYKNSTDQSGIETDINGYFSIF